MDARPADRLRGALLGERYRILGRLARSATATVYRARDERLERDVAVKIIDPGYLRDARLLHRFVDEATTVARLTHPNVVAVYDQGSHAGAPYLVLEHVKGRTLRDVLIERQRLEPTESLAVLEQVLAGLAAGHRAGLVHQDIRPENVLVTPPPNGSGDLLDAVVKVADFGLPRAIDRPIGGQMPATAPYAAPEVVGHGRADPRCDVYSAGIILFEMLTGRLPVAADRSNDGTWHHPWPEVPPPSRVVPGLPPLLDRIVARATWPDPAGRPRDAGAMLADVRAAREDVAALAGPTRALAHPTVVVGQVAPRPAWTRLPGPRGPALTVARRRFAELVPAGGLRAGWNSALSLLDRLRATQRGRRQLIAALVAIVLVLAAGGWWLGVGRYTRAPVMVALTKANAVAEAHRLGFDLAYAAGRYSEQVPIDTVLDQRPAPGHRIVKGGTITLVLSLGPERYPVPEVAGQLADFATAQLKEHFIVSPQSGFSDTVPVNYVVGTEPPAGTPLPPNSTVRLIIAKGPFPVHVPGVIGRQLAQAQQVLQGMGFTVEVRRRDDEGHPRDQVLEQNPAEGQGLTKAEGTTVVLVVANGPPGPPMPSLIGARCTDAINQLRAMGLQVNANGNIFEQFFWHVQSQQPEPNTPVQPGQAVELRCG